MSDKLASSHIDKSTATLVRWLGAVTLLTTQWMGLGSVPDWNKYLSDEHRLLKNKLAIVSGSHDLPKNQI